MRTVLITGAGSGIGAATAVHLDRSGWRVFAGVRPGDDTHALDSAGSEHLTTIELDVTVPASITAAVTRVSDRIDAAGGRGLDALVNGAGIAEPGPLELVDIGRLRQQFEVNVFGLVAVTQQFLPIIRPVRGRVLFVGSVGGRVAAPFSGSYNAARYALEAIADSWRIELGSDDVMISLIEPGPIATPIWSKAATKMDALIDAAGKNSRYAGRLEAFQERLRRVPKNAPGPQGVAEAIATALDAKHPRPRYLVGAQAKAAFAARRLLPDRLFDRLATRIQSG